MANECDFYFYDRGYCCRLLKEKNDNERYEVDSDWVHRYCWGYNYDDCPHYQNRNETSSGGCYLTSACVKSKGLPDDCYQLQVLRKFRDEYLAALPNGKEEIAHYYATAPLIVDKINRQVNSESIWNEIYHNLIEQCIKHIENKEFEEAHVRYKEYALRLEKTYIGV